MKAIFKREFMSYFKTPVGYIFLAAYYLFLGLFFLAYYNSGSPDMPGLIISMALVVTFTLPIITMRLFSEDRRQKTDQLIFTSPVSITSVVFGKYFAAMCIYAIGFAPTVVFELIIKSYVSVSLFGYVYALFGMMLLGSALIAIGMLVSSLTESPAVAAILALAINIFALYVSLISLLINVKWLSAVAEKIAFVTAVQSFAKSVLSVPNIVYFLSITAAFLFLTVRSLEKKRWA